MGDEDFKLEKMRVHERLGDVEREVKVLADEVVRPLELRITEFIAVCKERDKRTEDVHARMCGMIERHDKLLMGSNSNPGMKTRVDRLEQTEKARQNHIKLIWTAVVTLVGNAVIGWWKR